MRIDELFNAQPEQTLYVCRNLANADELVRWARRQGFTTLISDHFHVTIAYSKKKVPWNKAMACKDTITVQGGRREIRQFGKATVLCFESAVLDRRWAQLHDALGTSWDHPHYAPHVTLTWDRGDLDIAAIAPFDGALVFGPEQFRPVDANWQQKATEQPTETNGNRAFPPKRAA